MNFDTESDIESDYEDYEDDEDDESEDGRLAEVNDVNEMIDVDEGEEEGWKKELRYFWAGKLRRGLVALGLTENTTHRHAVDATIAASESEKGEKAHHINMGEIAWYLPLSKEDVILSAIATVYLATGDQFWESLDVFIGLCWALPDSLRGTITRYEASLLLHLTMIISNQPHIYMSVTPPYGQPPQVSLEYEEENAELSQGDYICAAYNHFKSGGVDELENALRAVPILGNEDGGLWIRLFSDELVIRDPGIRSVSAIPGPIGTLATATINGNIVVPRAKKWWMLEHYHNVEQRAVQTVVESVEKIRATTAALPCYPILNWATGIQSYRDTGRLQGVAWNDLYTTLKSKKAKTLMLVVNDNLDCDLSALTKLVGLIEYEVTSDVGVWWWPYDSQEKEKKKLVGRGWWSMANLIEGQIEMRLMSFAPKAAHLEWRIKNKDDSGQTTQPKRLKLAEKSVRARLAEKAHSDRLYWQSAPREVVPYYQGQVATTTGNRELQILKRYSPMQSEIAPLVGWLRENWENIAKISTLTSLKDEIGSQRVIASFVGGLDDDGLLPDIHEEIRRRVRYDESVMTQLFHLSEAMTYVDTTIEISNRLSLSTFENETTPFGVEWNELESEWGTSGWTGTQGHIQAMETFTRKHSETIERIKRVQNTWSHLSGALEGAETSLSSFKEKSPQEINTHGSADDVLSWIAPGQQNSKFAKMATKRIKRLYMGKGGLQTHKRSKENLKDQREERESNRAKRQKVELQSFLPHYGKEEEEEDEKIRREEEEEEEEEELPGERRQRVEFEEWEDRKIKRKEERKEEKKEERRLYEQQKTEWPNKPRERLALRAYRIQVVKKAKEAWNKMVNDRNLKLTPAVRLVVGEHPEESLLTDSEKLRAITQCDNDVKTAVEVKIKNERDTQVQSAADDAWGQMVTNDAHLTQAVQLVVTDDWMNTHHIITKGQNNTTKDEILKEVEQRVKHQHSNEMMVEQTTEQTTEEGPMPLALLTIKKEGSD